MDLNKNYGLDNLWYVIIKPVMIVIISSTILKIIWAFLNCLKWIFKDYSHIRKDIEELKKDTKDYSKRLTRIEDSIIQIKEKLK